MTDHPSSPDSVPAEPPAGLIAAQNVAREIVARLQPLIVEGVTEVELEQHVLRLGQELGADGVWTTPTTRVGIGTTVCHPAFPMQDRVALPGDTVIIDVNPSVGGWLGDFCVSFAIEPAPRGRELVEAVRLFQTDLIALVVPGMLASELYGLGAVMANSRGLKLLDLLDNFGHSLDTEFAASGFIDATNHSPMWGGWTIEPQLGSQGMGAKFEDILWLTPGQAPILI